MKDMERHQLTALSNVSDFGAQHPALFPPIQLAGELLATINSVVAELNSLAAAQVASTNTGLEDTEGRAAARIALRHELEIINRTAHAIAVRKPGTETRFRLTRGNDQELIALARTFATEATPLKDEFIHYGLPADFLDELNNDILDFEQAVATRQRNRASRTASTAGIEDALERGMDALKQLDGIMRNVLRNDVQMLAAWITASHVERPPRPRKPSTPKTPTVPTAPVQ